MEKAGVDNRAQSRRRTVLAVLAGAAAVYALRGVLGQVAGVLLASALVALAALAPARLLERRLRRSTSALISVAALMAALAAAVVFGLPALARQAGQYIERLPELLDAVDGLTGRVNQWLAKAGLPADALGEVDLLAGLSELPARLGTSVLPSLMNAGRYLAAPVLAYYMVSERAKLADSVQRFLPSRRRARIWRFLSDTGRVLSHYVRGQLIISLITGALTAAGLALVGVDAALLLGLLMGIFTLIPYFGSLLGMIPIAFFAWAQGLSTLLWALGVALAVQQIESMIVTPRVLSGAAGFHPAVVILLMTVGGCVTGVWGMVLIVPAATVLRCAWDSLLRGRLYAAAANKSAK